MGFILGIYIQGIAKPLKMRESNQIKKKGKEGKKAPLWTEKEKTRAGERMQEYKVH